MFWQAFALQLQLEILGSVEHVEGCDVLWCYLCFYVNNIVWTTKLFHVKNNRLGTFHLNP